MDNVLLLCGSRDWTDGEKIMEFLKINTPQRLVTGGAHGADMLGGAAAEQLGIPYRYYLPNWNRYGKAAGMKRNQEMLDSAKPSAVVAFSSHIHNSRGTLDMIRRGLKAGLIVHLVEPTSVTVFNSEVQFQLFVDERTRNAERQPQGDTKT